MPLPFRQAAQAASSSSVALPKQKPTTLALALRKLSPPVPLREGVKRVTLAYNKDAHAAARHFARDFYPRVAYSNKHIAFGVQPMEKPPKLDAGSPPQWVIELEDGTEKRITLPPSEKPARILKRLVDEVGAVPFTASLVAEAPAEGVAV